MTVKSEFNTLGFTLSASRHEGTGIGVEYIAVYNYSACQGPSLASRAGLDRQAVTLQGASMSIESEPGHITWQINALCFLSINSDWSF